MTLNLLRSEWNKFGAGFWCPIILTIGILVTLLGLVATAIVNTDLLDLGAITPAAATAEAARFWFPMHLFASIVGGIYVTREFSTGVIGRSVLLSQRRSQVVFAKLLTILTFSALLALLIAGLAVVTPMFAVEEPFTSEWTRDATLTVVGVSFAIVAGGAWGLFLGFVIRSSAGVVGILLLTTLGVDETIFRLLPSVGKFSFTIALGAAFRDAREDLLSPTMGYVVAALWLLAAGGLAVWSFNRRDVL